MAVIVIRYETTATARWALSFIVRTFFDDTIPVAVWTDFHVHLMRMLPHPSNGRAVVGGMMQTAVLFACFADKHWPIARFAFQNVPCDSEEGVAFLAAYVGGPMSAESQTMRIFIFRSDKSPDLRAFSDDQDGNKLPAQFRPWHAIGVIRPDATPPHNLNRDVIEASITDVGFQLWRMKK